MEDNKSTMSLAETWQCMPKMLQQGVVNRFLTGGTAALLGVIAITITREWNYAAAFVLAIIACGTGFDILWKVSHHKVIVARAYICKAKRGHKLRQVQVILRSADVENVRKDDYETFTFNISVQRNDLDLLTPGTLINIYYSVTAPDAILAYEILD